MNKTITINKIPVEFQSTENGFFSSTKDIADVFEKDHKLIMRKLRDFPDFGALVEGCKIAPYSYIAENGKENPMYMLDRDVHNLIVMSFTGEKAYWWKRSFIDAFNLMEKLLYDEKNKELNDLKSKLTDQNIHLWEKQLIPMEKIEHALQAHARMGIRQSTLVQYGTRDGDYKIAESIRTAAISQINKDFDQILKREHNLAREWFNSTRAKLNNHIQALRNLISSLFALGEFSIVDYKQVDQVEEKIKELEAKKVDEYHMTNTNYSLAKEKIERDRAIAIERAYAEHEHDIKIKKEKIDDWYKKYEELAKEVQDGKVLHEEMIKFLAEGFNPNDLEFTPSPTSTDDIKF